MQEILLGEHPDLVTAAGVEEMTAYALGQLGLKPDALAVEEVTGTTEFVAIKKDPIPYRRIGPPQDQSVDITSELGAAELEDDNDRYSTEMVVLARYNRGAAARYALEWSKKDGKRRNPNYPDFNTSDCTNFVSQAVFTGGVPQRGGGSCGSENSSDEGYVNRSDWWCVGSMRDWAWSNSWSVVYPFRAYMTSKGYANAWLYPRTSDYINQLVYDGYEGDVIQLRAQGTSYHTMIVTSWYWNNWNSGDLYVTYHSSGTGNDVREQSIRSLIGKLPPGQEVIFVPIKY